MVDIILRTLEPVANDVRLFDPAQISASGVMVGTASITFAASANMTSDGALAGTASLTFAASSTLTGSGAMSGTASLIFGSTAALVGDGSLAGASTILFAAAGDLVPLTPAVVIVAKPEPQGGAWIRTDDDGSVQLHASHLHLSGLRFGAPSLRPVVTVSAKLALSGPRIKPPRLTRNDMNEITEILDFMNGDIWKAASLLRAA